MAVKKTHEQFLQDLLKINDTIELLSQYTASRNPVECRCKICGHIWSTAANNLLQGTGCKKCSKARVAASQTKDEDTFLTELRQISPDIRVLDGYHGAQHHVCCECLTCGNRWQAKPTNLLAGKRCSVCSHKKGGMKKRITSADFAVKMAANSSTILYSGEYTDLTSTLNCVCKKCGFVWQKSANALWRGVGCPRCNNARRYSPDQFWEEVHRINPNIQVLGEYQSSTIPVNCRCLLCGHEWAPSPSV